MVSSEGAEIEALLMSLVAGLSTGLGGSVIFCVNTVSNRLMSFTLSLAAGVMTAVSLLELMTPVTQGRLLPLIWSFCGAGLYGLLRLLLPESNQAAAAAAGHKREDEEAGTSIHLLEKSRQWRLAVLMMATLTAHNLPEGRLPFNHDYLASMSIRVKKNNENSSRVKQFLKRFAHPF
jgi:ZIP family zinc transporter